MYLYCWFAAFLREYQPYFNISLMGTIFLFIGKLILSLDKDTYEETGLQGHPSRCSGRKPMRFGKYYMCSTGV